MQKVTVQQARKDFSRLLDAVAAGDEVIIMRRNKPAATLTAAPASFGNLVKFPDRSEFRRCLPRAKTSSAQLLREMREERD